MHKCLRSRAFTCLSSAPLLNCKEDPSGLCDEKKISSSQNSYPLTDGQDHGRLFSRPVTLWIQPNSTSYIHITCFLLADQRLVIFME